MTGLPFTRRLIIDAAFWLEGAPPEKMHDSIRQELLLARDPADRQVWAAFYSASLRAGHGDTLARLLGDIVVRASGRMDAYRVDHDGLCSLWRIGECDACTRIHDDLLDEALTQLELFLGDRAVADIALSEREAAGSPS